MCKQKKKQNEKETKPVGNAICRSLNYNLQWQTAAQALAYLLMIEQNWQDLATGGIEREKNNKRKKNKL